MRSRRHGLFWAVMLGLCSTPGGAAELHRFESADGGKDFVGELRGYDPDSELVRVKVNSKLLSFPLKVLSQRDRLYVLDNGEGLAMANQLAIHLERYIDKHEKRVMGRKTDRIYPSGYEVRLTNRSQRELKKIKLTYTVYYGVQGYLDPARTTMEFTGRLYCKALAPGKSVTLRTKPVDIVSGVLEPVLADEVLSLPEGDSEVLYPGGRRKDQLIGCSVDLVVNRKVVKRVREGSLQLAQKELEP
ncbi:MAG: hypothetical protein ACQKBU_01810 [Verrucomicrobiales bacterium]